eukprot:1139974-Pelagomonas_calceolata.AAC.4
MAVGSRLVDGPSYTVQIKPNRDVISEKVEQAAAIYGQISKSPVADGDVRLLLHARCIQHLK